MSRDRPLRLPAVIAHADWSLDASKRWVARAVHEGGGRYHAFAPEPVGELARFLDRIRGCARQAGRSGNKVLCSRATPSTKRFIKSSRQSTGES